MSQKTYMYDTQWTALINAINGGDTSAIATALGQIKTSIDSITTALGSLSTDVIQDSTQWTNLINAISSGGGGGGGTIDIDATQWSDLLTEIAKGDMTATATALGNIKTSIETALGQIKTSIDSITTALGSLSTDVTQDSTQWTNLINAISSGGGGGGGTIDIDATQWNDLLTEIAKGDMTATATALGNIKTSIDNVYTRLNSIGFDTTQWGNLVNAISNQSLTVDLSNVTSSAVTNLSRIPGQSVSDALNNISERFFDYIKVKSFYVQAGTLTTNMDLTSYATIDPGYKFLVYMTLGSANSFVPTFPIYISAPTLRAGRPWWTGTIPSNGSVIFTYLEIRDL